MSSVGTKSQGHLVQGSRRARARDSGLRLPSRPALLVLAVGLGVLLAAMLIVGTRSPDGGLGSFRPLPSLADRARLSLLDQDGAPRRLEDYRGKVQLVFFGFVRCPDVCPTQLFTFAQVLRRLGRDRARVQVVFVSLDPQRDTPPILKQYVAAFDPSFVALTGSPTQVAALAKSFYVAYRQVPIGRDYTVDHTAATFLIDKDARQTFVATGEPSPPELLQSLQTLLMKQG